MPVILKVTQSIASTDSNGLASVVAASGGFSPPVEVDVMATAGTGATLDDPLLIFPPPLNEDDSAGAKTPVMVRPIRGTVLRNKTAEQR